jgi:hypothetical protein
VIFAIAAARAGVRTVSVPIRIARQDLTAWLRDEPVVIVFVGLREQLGKWRAALQEAARPRGPHERRRADQLNGAVRPAPLICGAGRALRDKEPSDDARSADPRG